MEKKSIRDVFNKRSILITGATGFVGKVLLEKFMRSCRGIERIYVVIRPKYDVEVPERLRKLFDEEVFGRIKQECPEMFDRVIALVGDVSKHECELNPTDLKKVCDEVSVVFHCAASVRFDEKFSTAVSANIKAVRNALDLSLKMSKIEGFVHVSTAYAFCNQEEIGEEIYPELVKLDDLLGLCMWMNDKDLEDVFQKLKCGRPSIYHFTKAVAENVISSERKDLPVCIVRPSIVTAAWKEPFPGWVDTYNGPSGLLVICGKGFVKTIRACPDTLADFIPVDVVANTIIVAAWNMLLEKNPIRVVNCTSNRANPLTWGDVEKICLPLLSEYPSMNAYRYPGGSFKKSAVHNMFSQLIHHIIPAYVVEILSRMIFRPFRLAVLYKKIHNVLAHLEYFTTHQFDFSSPFFFKLMEEMNREDAEVFNIDIRPLNWNKYFRNYVLGVRKYLLNEDEDTLPEARKRLNRIYYLTMVARIAVMCGTSWLLYRRSSRVRHVSSMVSASIAPRLALLEGRIEKSLKYM